LLLGAGALMSSSLEVGREYRGLYRVLSRVGTGGTSEVYKLFYMNLGRPVCLKKGVPGKGYSAAHLRQLFAAEAKALQRLSGRFAPTLYEFREAELELYMEFCEGRSLHDYHEGRKAAGQFLSPVQALQVTRLVGRAVAHCHGQGVLLADLKPRNAILTGQPLEGDGA